MCTGPNVYTKTVTEHDSAVTLWFWRKAATHRGQESAGFLTRTACESDAIRNGYSPAMSRGATTVEPAPCPNSLARCGAVSTSQGDFTNTTQCGTAMVSRSSGAR